MGRRYLPANRCARHCRNNPWSPASEEATPAELSLDDGSSVKQALYISNLSLLTDASCLKKCLDHIQWRGDASGESACQPSGRTMRDWVILFPRVHDFR